MSDADGNDYVLQAQIALDEERKELVQHIATKDKGNVTLSRLVLIQQALDIVESIQKRALAESEAQALKDAQRPSE
jgi:hypothetical protein